MQKQNELKNDNQVVVTAKSACKRCYGRGIIGTNIKSGKKVICNCVEVVTKKKEIKA